MPWPRCTHMLPVCWLSYARGHGRSPQVAGAGAEFESGESPLGEVPHLSVVTCGTPLYAGQKVWRQCPERNRPSLSSAEKLRCMIDE